MKLTPKDLALFGLVSYFTFIGGTFYSQLNFFLRVANQVIVTLILGVWLFNRLRKGASLPRTPLDGAIALYLAANFLSAGLGQSPRFSLEGVWFTLTHFLAFYVLVDLLRRGWTARLARAFLMASAVVCLVGLAEFLAWYFGGVLFPGWWGIGGWQQPIPPTFYRLAITLNGSTPLSAYLALLIPPVLGLLLTLPARHPERPALWLWLALALPVQILTFSRAGVLALAVSLSLTALGWFLINGRQRFSIRPYWQRLTLFQRLLGLAVGVLLLGLGLFWLQSSFANRAGSTQFRFVLWDVALTVFQQHPLTGAGPGNFGRALLRLNQAGLPRLQIASAHNIYLNTAAELGLAGLLAGGYLLFRLGQAGWQHWQRLTTAPERLRLLTCGAALTGLLAQTLVDAYSATPIILLVAALAAMIVAPLDSPPAPHRQRGAAALAAVLLVVYAAGFVRLAQADLSYQRSFSREEAGNLPEAVAQARQSRELDPWLAGRTFRLALLEARLAQQNDDASLRQAAIEHYRTGLAQEPIWGLNSANLAGLLWQEGQRAEAISAMQRSLAAEKEPLYLVNLGYFYEQEDRWAEARAAYGQALALEPELAGSGFWQAAPARAEQWPLIVEEALKFSPANPDFLPVELALARAEFDTVEALLEPEPDLTDETVRHALAEVYLSRGQPDRAAALLAPAQPVSAADYLLWGRIKVQEGDDTAETLLRTAAFLGSNLAHYYLGQLYEGRGDLPAAEAAYRRGFLPHFTAENIEITIYGRASANDLAPQLLRMGVSPAEAAPWLELARLYEDQQRFEEARQIYEFLLLEDPFLSVSRERLARLEGK